MTHKNETLGAPTHVYKVTHKKRHAMRIRDGRGSKVSFPFECLDTSAALSLHGLYSYCRGLLGGSFYGCCGAVEGFEGVGRRRKTDGAD